MASMGGRPTARACATRRRSTSAREIDDPVRRGVALLALADLDRSQGRLADARGWAEDGLRAIEPTRRPRARPLARGGAGAHRARGGRRRLRTGPLRGEPRRGGSARQRDRAPPDHAAARRGRARGRGPRGGAHAPGGGAGARPPHRRQGGGGRRAAVARPPRARRRRARRAHPRLAPRCASRRMPRCATRRSTAWTPSRRRARSAATPGAAPGSSARPRPSASCSGRRPSRASSGGWSRFTRRWSPRSAPSLRRHPRGGTSALVAGGRGRGPSCARSASSRGGGADRGGVAPRGDMWALSRPGRDSLLRDSKGIRYLAELIAAAGREINVLELAGAGLDEHGSELLDEAARAPIATAGGARGGARRGRALRRPERAARLARSATRSSPSWPPRSGSAGGRAAPRRPSSGRARR